MLHYREAQGVLLTSESLGNKDIHKERKFRIKGPAWIQILQHEGALCGLGQP